MRQVRVPDDEAGMVKRRALYVCKFSLAGALTLTTSTREIHPVGGYLDGFVGHVATPSNDGDIELRLDLNGLTIADLTILEGESYAIEEDDLPLTRVDALVDYLEVTITSTGTGASDLTAFAVFS